MHIKGKQRAELCSGAQARGHNHHGRKFPSQTLGLRNASEGKTRSARTARNPDMFNPSKQRQ